MTIITSREPTTVERDTINESYSRYLAVADTTENSTVLRNAWARYKYTLDRLNAYPSLYGYRIRVKDDCPHCGKSKLKLRKSAPDTATEDGKKHGQYAQCSNCKVNFIVGWKQ